MNGVSNDDPKKAKLNGPGGAATGTFRSYLSGFLLSLVLTTIPFVLVMRGQASPAVMALGIAGAGTVQVMAHLHFFLHLDASSRSRWNVLALIFALLIMVLVVGGTVWIMHNLAYNLQ